MQSTVEPPMTPAFQDGQVTFDVAVGEVGQDVQLFAYRGTINGTSNPFDVVAADVDHIELVSGDQQFAEAATPLADPLVVRVVATDGEPAAAVDVTFAVTGGGGHLGEVSGEPVSERVVTTDAAGLASVWWTLGPVIGPQHAEARLTGAEGSPVVFTARADPDSEDQGYTLEGEGGGCSCRQTGPVDPPFWPAVLALLCLLGLRRRE
jgi:MYXO-CTERM domain-containing protein